MDYTVFSFYYDYDQGGAVWPVFKYRTKDAMEKVLLSTDKIAVESRFDQKDVDMDFLYNFEGTLKTLAARIVKVEKIIRDLGYDPELCKISIESGYDGAYHSLVLGRYETDDEFEYRQAWIKKYLEAEVKRKEKAEKAKAIREANKLKKQREKIEKEKAKLAELQKKVKELERATSTQESSA